jgi:hypothetical protein
MTAGTSLTFTERSPTAYPLSFGGANSQSNVPWLYYGSTTSRAAT